MDFILYMKYYYWNNDKNEKLKKERGISFEDIIYYIENKNLRAVLRHNNQEKYPAQKIYVVEINNYAYLVPFIESEKEIFLKTIIPSRKVTKNIWRQKMKYKLDNEEKEVLNEYENDEYVGISDMEKEMEKHSEYAKATFTKNKRINIRISQRDLEHIQRIALEEGIPYQTLIASLVHKYTSGKLVGKDKVSISS